MQYPPLLLAAKNTIFMMSNAPAHKNNSLGGSRRHPPLEINL